MNNTSEDLAVSTLCDLMDGIEAGIASARQRIKEAKLSEPHQTINAVKEETFTLLTFDDFQGAKLGDYGLAYKEKNLLDKWASAYAILRQNNATISRRYHGEGYTFSYWLYGDNRIYRQKLKPQV